MASTQAALGALLTPGILDMFGKEYTRFKPVHDSIYQEFNSRRAFEEFLQLTGIGRMVEREGLEPTSMADPAQGFVVQVRAVAYARGIGIDEMLLDDDQYGVVKQFGSFLGVSARETENSLAAEPFNNGFVVNGYDAVPWFSSSHPMVGGGVLDNLLDAADLSMLWVEAADQLASQLVDDNGLPIDATIEEVIIPRAERFTAAEIFKSSYNPDSGSFGVNPITEEGYSSYKVWNYLSDSDACFARTNVRLGQVCIKRKKPFIRKDNNESTLGLYWYCHQRIVFAPIDPRGMLGNPGAS